jgi:PAS domain S-box-containing protein
MYPDPILGYAYTASAPTLLAGYLVNLKNAWTTVRFGTGTATGVGISGVSSEIDSILDHPFCNNTQNIDCMSLDRIMVVTDFWVNNHIQNYKNYTMQQRLVVANDTFKVAMRGLSLSTEAIKIYTAISQASCTLPIPSAIVYLGVFILLLLLVIPLHVYVQHYMDVNHRIRCMLAFIPSTTNDNIPRLVEYVNGFNLYTIDTDKIGKNKSMNYMETFVSACLDGALICSERATIICVNTAVRDMFRCNAEDVVGQPLNVLFDTTELENIIIDILKIGTGVTKEFNAVRKDKSIYPARVSVSSVTFDKKRYLICFISDLTVDHKQKDLIAIEKKNNEKLLLSILPAAVATRLKKGETCISEKIESCTCFFSDMVGFTKMSSTMSAANLVETLNAIVNRFDDLSLYVIL